MKDRWKRGVSGGAHRRQTESQMVLVGFAIVLLVGGLLVALLWGPGPATMAVALVLLAAGLLLVLYEGLSLLESWLKRG